MLKVDHISTGYGKRQILFDISFEIDEKEIVMLMGGNGSGKSTLLKSIYSLLSLWDGSIFFENSRIDKLKPYDLINRGIVYIPQKNFCFENMTIEENLRISATSFRKNELTKRINLIYDQTHLGSLRKRKPFNLSGGEKKMLGLSMGLLHSPKLVLFDEPFSGLDEYSKHTVINSITNVFNSSCAFIIVSHEETELPSEVKKIRMRLGKLDQLLL